MYEIRIQAFIFSPLYFQCFERMAKAPDTMLSPMRFEMGTLRQAQKDADSDTLVMQGMARDNFWKTQLR